MCINLFKEIYVGKCRWVLVVFWEVIVDCSNRCNNGWLIMFFFNVRIFLFLLRVIFYMDLNWIINSINSVL